MCNLFQTCNSLHCYKNLKTGGIYRGLASTAPRLTHLLSAVSLIYAADKNTSVIRPRTPSPAGPATTKSGLTSARAASESVALAGRSAPSLMKRRPSSEPRHPSQMPEQYSNQWPLTLGSWVSPSKPTMASRFLLLRYFAHRSAELTAAGSGSALLVAQTQGEMARYINSAHCCKGIIFNL